MSAPLADEGGLLRQAMKARAAVTLRAPTGIAASDCEQMFQADVVGGKTARELAENFGL